MSKKQADDLSLVRRFARNLAHDANNLTGTILVLSELLAMPELASPERTADIAARIRKACWHLQVKVNQPVAIDHLVAAARGRISTDRILEVAHDLASSLAPKKVTLRVVGPEKALTSSGTPLLYAILIFNLLRNAIEAIGDNKGEVTLRIDSCNAGNVQPEEATAQCGAVADGQHYLRLSVEDSGGGFDAGIADAAFTPFVSSDSTGRRLGLGLHYVETVAVGLGGAVFARRGARTVVEVLIPATGERISAGNESGGEQADGIGVLRHVAVVAADRNWASSFAALAGPFGGQVSVFDGQHYFAGEESENYSAVVLAGSGVDHARLEALHEARTPFMVIADPQQDPVRQCLENIRPFNLVRPAPNSATEALHRLISYGAIQ